MDLRVVLARGGPLLSSIRYQIRLRRGDLAHTESGTVNRSSVH